MKAKELINYKSLSMLICGNDNSIRKNKCPEIHKPKVIAFEFIVQSYIDSIKRGTDKGMAVFEEMGAEVIENKQGDKIVLQKVKKKTQNNPKNPVGYSGFIPEPVEEIKKASEVKETCDCFIDEKGIFRRGKIKCRLPKDKHFNIQTK